MEKNSLVSIVTPCHNSGNYIHRLLDSILQQTYMNVEMIAVDNDSKDDTAEIIKNYVPRFRERGYKLSYIHQDDLGPSAGVQTGIRMINGDYLLMPDSDDYYASQYSIERFVKKFEDLPDNYAIVRCQQTFINEETMKPMGISYAYATEDDPGTLFEDCLFGKNGYNFAPINYMVKVSALRKETALEIYNAYNTGQQRQICLPLYYKYKAWTILEPLVCYLVRKNSISHGDYAKYSTQKELYKKSPLYIDSILDRIDSMPSVERIKYRNAFLMKETERMCKMAKCCGENDDLRVYIEKYKEYGGNAVFLKIKLIKFFLGNIIKRIM